MRSDRLAEVAPLIRAHHERLDGSGYPDGIVGDAIPLKARIIAVADVWDALTCDRPYRRALGHDAAARILWSEAGTALDLRCVEALFAHLSLREPSAEARSA
jgi:HD-GYP domain-containing protein (c-di-GMP phosphodiesterase class II)